MVFGPPLVALLRRDVAATIPPVERVLVLPQLEMEVVPGQESEDRFLDAGFLQ